MTNYERMCAGDFALHSRQWSSLLLSNSMLFISLSLGRESSTGVRCFRSPCPRPSSSSGSPSISEHQRRVLWGEWPLPVAAPVGSCPFSPQFRAYPANSSGGGGTISLRQWTGAAGEAWASRARVLRPRQRAGHQSRARTRTKAGSLNGLTTSRLPAQMVRAQQRSAVLLQVNNAPSICTCVDCHSFKCNICIYLGYSRLC